ncbi:MAG: sodium:solute symporter [Candidatus Hydrogenedentota bacterium]
MESRLGFIDYAAIGIYFAVLIGMGLYFSPREKTTEAFFLGNRRIPWWAVGISIFGTSVSAITYIAIPATAFAEDWVTLLNSIGIIFLAPFVAIVYLPKLRAENHVTAYEYLEKRFNLVTRIYGSLIFAIFQMGRIGIVLYLPAIALEAATGLNITACIIAMGILATLYTVLGGIEAVIWTDVIQSVVLVLGAILALIIIITNIDGGFSGMITLANDADKFHTFNWTWDVFSAGVWVAVIGGIFASAYPAMADQTVVQRYLATADAKEATKALWTNAILTLPIQFLFLGIGTALWAYYTTHPGELDPELQANAILPYFVVQQFPTGLKGILIAGLFAASMSSLDSSMNSLSAVIVNDYYRRFVKNVSDERALWVARATTLLLGVIGTFSALYVATRNQESTLFLTFLKLLGLVGGGLAGIFILGVLTKRANGIGAIAGGLVSGIVMYYVRTTEVHFFLHGMIGLTTAFVVGYLISLVAEILIRLKNRRKLKPKFPA